MTKEWGRLTKWLEKDDPYLAKWRDWFAGRDIPCEIRKNRNGTQAVFIYRHWHRSPII
jgi:hypothetical protein